jgi:transcriptional regulator with XRE-family HTH domain
MKFINTNLVRNLKRLRTMNLMTQEEFVSKIQTKDLVLTRSAYAKVESGCRHLTFEELKAIKEFYKVSFDDILE